MLNQAKIDRALRTIEQFAPNPPKPVQAPMNRDLMIRHIVDHFHPILKRARNDELAEIVAIFDEIRRRHNL